MDNGFGNENKISGKRRELFFLSDKTERFTSVTDEGVTVSAK